MHVLVIDDDLYELNPHVESLRKAGFSVATCDNVEVGCDMLADKSVEIDVLVLDVMMPPLGLWTAEETENGGLTGLRVLVRVQELRPLLPVVLLTVRLDMLGHLASLPCVRNVVPKPCMPAHLRAVVNSAAEVQ